MPRSMHCAALLSLLAGSVAVAATANAEPRATPPSDPIGRLQRAARTCSSNLAEAPQAPCSSVQFEQQTGQLTIRFISAGLQPEESNQLVFVGVLAPGSPPMDCQQGRCQLREAISTTVASVSERSFDGRGLAKGLPQAWPANGSCQVERNQVRCKARALSQELWSAEAGF
ncbi:hypothetical protein KQ313_00090 [Synechococcus sp. CS-1325]|uniref:hypothetical protein n=1 Tax=Synechococcus sp. CS-1325 TaxID=2847979 RepID=UPI00223C4428|nr:hypothetical protein [Synechococcus sp. CS-1325]MCT0198092.1 hypothetical protein [Synechococcus sp. CS-1325]